jgi:hypothetical protein
MNDSFGGLEVVPDAAGQAGSGMKYSRTELALLVFLTGCFGLVQPQAAVDTLRSSAPQGVRSVRHTPQIITVRRDASALETLAANEVRRYLYLRTGKLLRIKKGAVRGDRIVVTARHPSFCGERGQNLKPQQFLLKTSTATGETI